MTGGAAPVVVMTGITRRFGPVEALRGVDFSCAAGAVHALLGENGAGKSTLMHVLFGMLRPHGGDIRVDGEAVTFRSPAAAMAAGLGMVHQHFTHVPALTVAENVWLGRPGWRFDRAAARREVARVAGASGLALDADAVAEDLPVGLQQRLEIVKALSRNVRVLILDEPTAALAPSETEELFVALRRLAASGTAIVLISHKLRDVVGIADEVTVLRAGRVAARGPAGAFDAGSLARAMIGESAGAEDVAVVASRRGGAAGTERTRFALRAAEVAVRGAHGRTVGPCTLDVRGGEIVGVAAIEGNGQRELLRAIAGLLPFAGAVEVAAPGAAFIPEDRHGEALLLDFTVAENLALGRLPRGASPRRIEQDARRLIAEFDIQPADPALPARHLSGGNQQKLVLARALAKRPALLVAENPTRGLDVHATAQVHDRLRRATRDDGAGALVYSSDLDEVLALADRVAVMNAGRWRWVADADRTRERVGAMMLAHAA